MFIAKHKDLLKLFMWKIIWQNTNLILNFYFYLFYEIIIKIKIKNLIIFKNIKIFIRFSSNF